MENERQDSGCARSSPLGKGNGRARPVPVLRRLAGLVLFAAAFSLAYGDEVTVVKKETADLPSFLFQPLYAGNSGSVYGIYEARHADLVLVRGGYDAGFQRGMVCRVADSESEVGEVMLVDVRNNCSAALILQLEPEKVIEPGHAVNVKTVKF